MSAGALVAIFAAKSLGIAIAGAAGFIALRMYFYPWQLQQAYGSLVQVSDLLQAIV